MIRSLLLRLFRRPPAPNSMPEHVNAPCAPAPFRMDGPQIEAAMRTLHDELRAAIEADFRSRAPADTGRLRASFRVNTFEPGVVYGVWVGSCTNPTGHTDPAPEDDDLAYFENDGT